MGSPSIDFAATLAENQGQVALDAELKRFVDDAFDMSLPELRQKIASEESPDFLQVYREAYDEVSKQFVDDVSGLKGYEQTVRFLTDLKLEGRLDDDDIKAVVPLVTEQARKPVEGMSMDVAREMWNALLPIADDLVTGGVGVAKYGPAGLVEAMNALKGGRDVPGTPVKPGDGLMSVWKRWQEMKKNSGGRQAVDLMEASTLQGTTESIRLFQRAARTILSDMGDYSQASVAEKLRKDVKFYEFALAVENGTAYPDLTEEELHYMQPMGEYFDLTGIGLPFGAGVKATKKMTKTVAALRLAKPVVKREVGAVRRFVGGAVEKTGQKVEKVADAVATNPLLAGGVTLAVTGGDLTSASVAALSAASEGGSKIVKRTLGAPGRALTSTGKTIARPFTGAEARAAEIFSDIAKGGAAGTATMTVLALPTAETAEEAGSLIAGGTIYGGAGASAATSRKALGLFADNFLAAPLGEQNHRAQTTLYGDAFDAQHAKAVHTLPNRQQNSIEALRQLVGSDERTFVLNEEDYASAMAEAGLPDNQGVARVVGPDGVSRTFVKLGGESLGHEVGHVIFDNLPDDVQQTIIDAVYRAYDVDTLAAMRANYESQSNGAIKLADDAALIREVISENFQLALNGSPLSILGTPPSLAVKIYDTFGAIAEQLGLRDTSIGASNVVTSDTLQWTPSFLVTRAIRNVMDARNLDPAIPADHKDLDGTITRVPAKTGAPTAPKTKDVGVLTPVPTELTFDPQSPFNPEGVTGEAGLTPEAEELLRGLEDGKSAPAFVSKRLLQIAGENGLIVTPSTRPADIIAELKAKQARAGGGTATPETSTTAAAPVEAPTPTAAPSIYATEDQRGALANGVADEQTQATNIDILKAEAAKPQAQRTPQQLNHNSAKVDENEGTKELTEPERLEQRRLADAGEVEGVANLLRALYDKVIILLRVAENNKNGKVTAFVFSFDKFIRNVDMLGGWLKEHPDAAREMWRVTGYTSLSDPRFVADVKTYFENQANGYRGDGGTVVLPADTLAGTFPSPNVGYTPVELSPDSAGLINTLIGIKNVADWGDRASLKQTYIQRLAEANGYGVAEVEEAQSSGSKPKVGFNKVKADLRRAGFDPNLLHVTTEQLRIERMATPLKARPDLSSIKAPVGGFTQAGFMPDSTTKRTSSEEVRGVAAGYMKGRGIYTPHEEYVSVDEDKAKRIADFYESAQDAPNDPEVKAAYDALAQETMAQYQAMKSAGISVEPWESEGQPYASSEAMRKDVRDNKHLWFFLTDAGFGNEATSADSSLLAPSGVTINGKPLVINDIFRAVHDYFGHTKEGYEFGPRGELNAYLAHSRMFSDAAKSALAAETLAQNSWVNFGPHLRKPDGTLPTSGEASFVPIKDRKFADQKNIVIPPELTDSVEPESKRAPETMEEHGQSVIENTLTQIKSSIGNRGTFDATNPDIGFMPLKDARALTKDTQFKSDRKDGSLGGVLDLVHFSSREMRTIDPKKSHGKGAATPIDMRGLPRAYFYQLGTVYEANIAGRGIVYVAKVDGNAVYNLNEDPLNYLGTVNRAKGDRMLMRAGFDGMRGYDGVTDIVAMFRPVKLTAAAKADVYSTKKFAAANEGRPLAEADIDYQAIDDAWAKRLAKEAAVPVRRLFMPNAVDNGFYSKLGDRHQAGSITEAETAEAQGLVDAAAKAAGYNVGPVYRGADTTAPEQFDTMTRSAWFTSDKEDAADYGGSTSSFYLKADNLADLDSPDIAQKLKGVIKNTGDLFEVTRQMPNIRALLQGQFDGVRVESYGTGYAVTHTNPFNPSQIKSADPFTGVPLSQRFDSSTPDTTFNLARHAALESKHNAGSITEAETAEAQGLVDAAVTDFMDRTRAMGEAAMPATGTTSGDISLPLYRFVEGDELRDPERGMHWTHNFNEMEQMASESAGFILVAKHPGLKRVLDWESPNDRPDMEREIGGYKYRASVFPEVPIRQGSMEILTITQVSEGGDRAQIKSADPFTGVPLSQRFDSSTPDTTFNLARHATLERKHNAGRQRGYSEDRKPKEAAVPVRRLFMPNAVDNGFYSKLGDTLDQKFPGRTATEEQLKSVLGNNVKPDEVKWSGIIPKIEQLAKENNGKVPMEELRAYLADEGQVKFEEVVTEEASSKRRWEVRDHDTSEFFDTEAEALASAHEWRLNLMGQVRVDDVVRVGDGWTISFEQVDFDSGREAWVLYNNQGIETQYFETESEALEKLEELNSQYTVEPRYDDHWSSDSGEYYDTEEKAEKARDDELYDNTGVEVIESETPDATNYGDRVLPGGENYREVVLTLPIGVRDAFVAFGEDGYRIKGLFNTEQEGLSAAGDGGFVERTTTKDPSYTSSHFSAVPNYVAHSRLNERVDATGEPGLFLEEIQSDRHQAGRQRGYSEARKPQYEVLRNGVFEGHYESKSDAANAVSRLEQVFPNRAGTYSVEESKVFDQQDGVPDAPFRKEWPLAMFKRALRDAVAGGKSWIGWTVGETQAERYDLSKQVDSVAVGRHKTGWQVVARKDGDVVIDTTTKDDAELGAFIGKDLAKKAIESGGGTFSGVNLKLGGEGMKGFYDVMLPSMVGKYVKQWGAKVEDGELSTPATKKRTDTLNDGELLQELHRAGDTTPFHKVAITEAMRESVAAGQPLFMPSATDVLADPKYKKLWKNMTPSEKGAENRSLASGMVAVFDELPSETELVVAAKAGLIKRGWYARAAVALRKIFGPDTEQFAAVLAATSPQQMVIKNLEMSLHVWDAWQKAGRPTGTDVLKKLVAPLVDLDARTNNTVSALQGFLNPPRTSLDSNAKLSGFKVESFFRNLIGDEMAVTLDTWMAQFAGLDAGKMHGSKARYIAYASRVRAAAKKSGLTPAEVQETVWSFFKTLTELSVDGRTTQETLRILSDRDLVATPEFYENLTRDPVIRGLLEDFGFTDFDALVDPEFETRRANASSLPLFGEESRDTRVLDRVARRAGALALSDE